MCRAEEAASTQTTLASFVNDPTDRPATVSGFQESPAEVQVFDLELAKLPAGTAQLVS
jgi:hypothetical protein